MAPLCVLRMIPSRCCLQWLALVATRVRSEIVGGEPPDGCEEDSDEDAGVSGERVPLREGSGGKISVVSSVVSTRKGERGRQASPGDVVHGDDASIGASIVRPASAEQAGGPSLSALISSSDVSRGGELDREKASTLEKPFKSLSSVAEETGAAVDRETEADLRRRLLATMSQARKKRKETSASGEESMAS